MIKVTQATMSKGLCSFACGPAMAGDAGSYQHGPVTPVASLRPADLAGITAVVIIILTAT